MVVGVAETPMADRVLAPAPSRSGDARQGKVAGLLLMLVGLAFLCSVSNNVLGAMLVRLADQFHTSVAVVGRLNAFLCFAWAGVAVLAGPLSDVLGRRPMFILGLGLMAAGMLGAGLAWSFPSLAVFCIAIGAGGAIVGPPSSAAVGDLLPKRMQGRAFGLLNGAGSASSVVGLPLLSLVIAGLGWRWAFFALAVALGALLASFVLRYPKRQIARHGHGLRGLRLGERLWHVARRPYLLQLFMAGFAASTGWYVFWTYFPAALVNRFGVSQGSVALPLALVALGMVVGAYLGGETAQRRNRLAISVGAWVLTVMLAVATALVNNVVAYLALGFVFMLLQGLPFPSILATLNGSAGRHRAAVMGFFTFACQMGGFLGSLIGGGVISGAGYPALGFASAGAVGVAAIVLRLLPQPRPVHIPHRTPTAGAAER